MKNQDIRYAASAAGVKLWQIADELGVADYRLSKMMRHELDSSEKAAIRTIIRRLSKEENDAEDKADR